MKMFLLNVYSRLRKYALTLILAIVSGLFLGPLILEEGGSTIYTLGKVHCPIYGFEVDAELGSYPEIVCEEAVYLKAVVDPFFEESFISRNFRRFTTDDLRIVSRKYGFVCKKIQRDSLTLVHLYLWETNFSIRTIEYSFCEQAQMSIPEIVGSVRCLKNYRRCLT